MGNKQADYILKKKKILKWYEYVMTYPQEDIPEDIQAQIADDIPEIMQDSKAEGNSNSDSDIYAKYDKEEVDLSTTGLSEDDQALVADIMARFAQAKQTSVDTLFTAQDDERAADELINSICSSKQTNVDAMIKQAKSEK